MKKMSIISLVLLLSMALCMPVMADDSRPNMGPNVDNNRMNMDTNRNIGDMGNWNDADRVGNNNNDGLFDNDNDNMTRMRSTTVPRNGNTVRANAANDAADWSWLGLLGLIGLAGLFGRNRAEDHTR